MILAGLWFEADLPVIEITIIYNYIRIHVHIITQASCLK